MLYIRQLGAPLRTRGTQRVDKNDNSRIEMLSNQRKAIDHKPDEKRDFCTYRIKLSRNSHLKLILMFKKLVIIRGFIIDRHCDITGRRSKFRETSKSKMSKAHLFVGETPIDNSMGRLKRIIHSQKKTFVNNDK